jgi:DNA-binding response OmpR family regulator
MADAPHRILVVDDDPEIATALCRGLALHGYDADSESRADTAFDRLAGHDFDAAIVDVMLGQDSGLDLVARLREAGQVLPVVMLSALSEVEDRAAGLDAGADDYIVKPFSFDELVARLKVQERRMAGPRAELDRSHRAIRSPVREVILTDREFALLRLLAEHPGETLSRGMIFDKLWAEDNATSENVVDVYVGYLRRKLDPSRDFGFEIRTRRNRGFGLDGVKPRIV